MLLNHVLTLEASRSDTSLVAKASDDKPTKVKNQSNAMKSRLRTAYWALDNILVVHVDFIVKDEIIAQLTE